MKNTFNTFDVQVIVSELRNELTGMRISQIYDIDNKTYLFKLQCPDKKYVLLIESASRIHLTEFEWPKNPAPSGFSMKLRKHLRNKRLESIDQLGIDRVVDLTFGSGEVAYHVIVELYDRGNIVLTDHLYNIVNVLRPRKEGEDTKFIVHEVYPLHKARQQREMITVDSLKEAFEKAKKGILLKKFLNPLLDCGGTIIDDELLKAGFEPGVKLMENDNNEAFLNKLLSIAKKAQNTIYNKDFGEQGYIIKKNDFCGNKNDGEELKLYQEFHPKLFSQHAGLPYVEFSSFNKACDEYYSKMESVKLDMKATQQKKEALKKLENIKRDHERRVSELQVKQEKDFRKGQLIELNSQLVEGALLVLRSAIANQIDWKQIQELLDEAQSQGDPIACAIRCLKLETNNITMWLSDPYDFDTDDLLLDSDEEREEGKESTKLRPVAVDIDLDLSAMANARKYYNQKRQAAVKEQKTLDASEKAIKSASKKTQQTLKEVSSAATINKARKVHWFEKYLWFISSENFLVIAGRDGQQNEQVVKRHLRPHDVYVHADVHGATSAVIKNPFKNPVPPKTLHEAGIMALCYSRAWEEKIVTSAWWVWGDQVSKTAPTGEYLTTGSFMVRGKKNFLPPSHLVYGFGFLFRLEESSFERHIGERKIKVSEEDYLEAAETLKDANIEDHCNDLEEEQELQLDEEKDEKEKDDAKEEKVEESDNDDLKFPDTIAEVVHFRGTEYHIKMETLPSAQCEDSSAQKNKSFVDDVAQNLYRGEKQKKVGKTKENKYSSSQEMEKLQQLKRGQRSKLKKLKKYKDQDDEERELRMHLLQSAGSIKETKKSKGRKSHAQSEQLAKNKKKDLCEGLSSTFPAKLKLEEATLEEVEEDDVQQIADDINIINSLTGSPVAEDELLYAIPVCAPYSVLNNYKYKVKLVPGSGKKGKACKTALALFMLDKSCSLREKDLLRAIKDQDLTHNLPGKVKVSAPNIHKVKN